MEYILAITNGGMTFYIKMYAEPQSNDMTNEYLFLTAERGTEIDFAILEGIGARKWIRLGNKLRYVVYKGEDIPVFEFKFS